MILSSSGLQLPIERWITMNVLTFIVAPTGKAGTD